MNIAYNADCLAAMREMEDECIDLTVTSPPYDNIRDYHGYTFDWKETIKELFRITKQGGAVVVWIVNDQTVDGSESGTSFRQALWAKDCGFNLHDTMIWNKGATSFPDSNRYLHCFEYMFVFTKGAPKSTHFITDRKNVCAGVKSSGTWRQKDGSVKPKTGTSVYAEYGRRFNIWEQPPCQSNIERTGHPAQFPLRLASDHIRTWSDEGDTVLDPFLGSGTTRIAAYDLNRQFIGYEISEEYFRLQEERFARHTAQTSLFIDEF